MKKIILPLLLLVVTLGWSQNKESHTISYDESMGSPQADLSAISWMAGHWKGDAFGGITEEVWTPPLGGSMMCTFKLVMDGSVTFYEIVTITEEGGTLMLRLKHFHSNLKGWEEKDETVDFKLVKVTEDKVYFDGFTFERISDDEVNIYVVIDDDRGKNEVKFNYIKQI